MVVVASLMVLTLVLTVLTVTAASRRITARYGYFYGMYDLAVAGNENALFVIKRGLERHREAAHEAAQARILYGIFLAPEEYLYICGESGRNYIYPRGRYFEYFLEEVMPFLREEIGEYFPHVWGLNLEIDGVLSDNFQAATTVSFREENNFLVETAIHKNNDGVLTHTVRVQARIVWQPTTGGEFFCPIVLEIVINFLDYYTPKMVELWRL
jgi:hypothetical protein